VFGGFISPWHEPLTQSVLHLRRGKQALLDSGDYMRLGYGASYEILYRFLHGDDLDELEASLEDAVALMQRTRDVVNLRALQLVRRTIAEVRAHFAGTGVAEADGAFDQAIVA